MKFYVNHCNGIWGIGDGYMIWDMGYVGSLEGRIHGEIYFILAIIYTINKAR